LIRWVIYKRALFSMVTAELGTSSFGSELIG